MDRVLSRIFSVGLFLLLMAPALLSAEGATDWSAPHPAPPGLDRAWIEKGEVKGHSRHHFSAKGDGADIWKRWRASFVGWKTLDAMGDDKGGVVTLEEPNTGARVVLTFGPDHYNRAQGGFRGFLETIPLRQALARLPGACKKVPKRSFEWRVSSSSINQDGESHSANYKRRAETAQVLDVDGDGILDHFVPVVKFGGRKVAECPEQTRYEIWIKRGNCGHKVGVVGAGSLQHKVWKTPIGTSGLRDLTFEEQRSDHGARGIPHSKTITRKYRFKGRAYAKIDEQSRGGICHHCATWWCTRPK